MRVDGTSILASAKVIPTASSAIDGCGFHKAPGSRSPPDFFPDVKLYALCAGVVSRFCEIGAIFQAFNFTPLPVASTEISGAVVPE